MLRVQSVAPNGTAAYAGVAAGMSLRTINHEAAADLTIRRVQTLLLEASPSKPVQLVLMGGRAATRCT